MTHFEFALHDHALHFIGERQKPKQIACGWSRTSYRLSGGFMSKSKLINQPLQSLSFLNRIEVFPLNILDKSYNQGIFITYRSKNYWNSFHPSNFGCS